ncbi:fused MFS/spermidine synthase [Paratractidigestivibacter sp.]|uniref:spermidine synthase n=1 Tax=Paratractidigestivibacter sp. TaxID=2847316 RepID=UPI002ABE3210|nr:fused MFS/spermidine synthase [Paratractidigestivibacter sp.]
MDWMALFWWSCAVGATLVAIVAALPWLLRRRGVEMCRTMFGLTLIFDSEAADGTAVRLINVNGTFQSVSYVEEGLRCELACEYHREMARRIEARAAAAAREGRRLRVLMMGGGGFSLPKYLAVHVPEADVVVAEIDPEMVRIAREQFFLDECLEQTGAERDGRMRIVVGDAWDVVRGGAAGGTGELYDVIVNEAFGGKRPLGPMETAEGARVIREHLREGGAYIADVRCPLEGRGSAPLREVREAFGAVFASADVVPEWPDEPKKPGNNVFIAW